VINKGYNIWYSMKKIVWLLFQVLEKLVEDEWDVEASFAIKKEEERISIDNDNWRSNQL